jgi:leucyl/phenylalanyl-tRNA--protein transferase
MIAPDVLLQGYRLGVFPMAMDDGSIEWFSPDPRGILPLETFHVPHALQRVIRKGVFEVRINTSFREVMRRCATRSETWINREIIESYTRLHELGCAHSVETWHEGKLAGGLYGVSAGGAFFGESMFHEVTDASKSRCMRSWNGCARGDSRCSIPSGARRIWSASARSRFRVANTCICSPVRSRSRPPL